MNIGLDIGSYGVRSLRREGDALRTRSSRMYCAALKDSTSHRRLLEQAGLPFILSEDSIMLLGDAAWDSSDLFNTPCRPLLLDGHLPEDDPLTRQLTGTLIESVLPPAGAGSICCLTVPGGTDLQSGPHRTDTEFFVRIVRLRGFEPKIIPASQALILGELARSSFTGIGLVCGASGCEALLAHRGQPLCHARIDEGGHWIDRALATQHGESPAATPSASGLDVAQATRLREAIETAPREFAQATSMLLSHVVDHLVERFAEELVRQPRAVELPQPLSMICAGGLTRSPGFLAMLNDALLSHPWSVRCHLPRLTGQASRSILRGLLISAELEAAMPTAGSMPGPLRTSA